MNGKPGNLARRLARAAQGGDRELMRKWPCMVGTIALERLQTHSYVTLVLAKVINLYTVPLPITVLSLISVNCLWSDWNAWNDCSATCDGGTRLRSRFVKETAQNGGSQCTGGSAESQACGSAACGGSGKGWLTFHFPKLSHIACLDFVMTHSHGC